MSDSRPKEMRLAHAKHQVISFRLNKEDLTKIDEVVTRLRVVASGVDTSEPGAFTIRNHVFNAEEPGAFTIRNHNFSLKTGEYIVRNRPFSANR